MGLERYPDFYSQKIMDPSLDSVSLCLILTLSLIENVGIGSRKTILYTNNLIAVKIVLNLLNSVTLYR